MIRRATASGWTQETKSAPAVSVTESPKESETPLSRAEMESLLTQARQHGREDARAELAEAYETRRLADAEQLDQAVQSLRDARETITELCEGLADALARHAASIEASAVDIACAVTASLVHPLVVDGSVVAAMCSHLIGEFPDEHALLQVSPDDAGALPETIRGIRLSAVEGMPRGRCALVGSRGSIHGDVGERWQKITAEFRALLELPSL